MRQIFSTVNNQMRIRLVYVDELAAILNNSQAASVLKTTAAYGLRDTDCMFRYSPFKVLAQ